MAVEEAPEFGEAVEEGDLAVFCKDAGGNVGDVGGAVAPAAELDKLGF